MVVLFPNKNKKKMERLHSARPISWIFSQIVEIIFNKDNLTLDSEVVFLYITLMFTTNIAIVNEFQVEADDYHEFIQIKQTLSSTLGLIYSYKEFEVDPQTRSGKAYKACFTFQGIRHPAQYSHDIE